MIVTCAVLRDGTNGIGQRHPSRTLMTVDPFTATTHAVDVNTGADPVPRNNPDPAPLWHIVFRTGMVLGTAHLAPAVPVSSKETDMVIWRMW